MKILLSLLLLMVAGFTVPDSSFPFTHGNIRKNIADAYGYSHFDKIESVMFTFNARVDGDVIKREWKWDIKRNTVFYKEDGIDKAWSSYKQDEITNLPEEIRKVDSRFINDKYWLFFPFQLVWDEDADVTAEGAETEKPLGSGSAYKITVGYPEKGGYTPGDIYELYVNEEYMIEQWIYRRAGNKEPTRISTWEDNRSVGPLVVSFDHRGPDDEFRVWFTDVALKLSGSDEWIR